MIPLCPESDISAGKQKNRVNENDSKLGFYENWSIAIDQLLINCLFDEKHMEGIIQFLYKKLF